MCVSVACHLSKSCHMISEKTWLDKVSAKATAQAKMAMLQEYGIHEDAGTYAGTDEELAALPVWHRTATTKMAISLSKTGAAIPPKSAMHHDGLPRVQGWKKNLKEIGRAHGDASRHAKGYHGHVADLLYDVEFQHHQSTNGRWNTALLRWERHGVRSVEGWRYRGSVPAKEKQFCDAVPERTFHRIKDRLIDLGLIEAASHLWQGRTRLWMRPTDELSRILFEAGYWDQVRYKYVLPKVEKAKPVGKRKPRGISAIHKKLDAELLALYREIIAYKHLNLTKQDAWAMWERLTKPIPLGNGYQKAPFAEKGSYRWRRIYERLGLQYA